MGSLTQAAFIKAIIDKFEPFELCELLGIETIDIVREFRSRILERQSELEDELKYGH